MSIPAPPVHLVGRAASLRHIEQSKENHDRVVARSAREWAEAGFSVLIVGDDEGHDFRASKDGLHYYIEVKTTRGTPGKRSCLSVAQTRFLTAPDRKGRTFLERWVTPDKAPFYLFHRKRIGGTDATVSISEVAP